MFGSHLSIAGGLHLALLEAQRLKMDCVQVFTKNQQQWTAPPLKQTQIDLWRQHRHATRLACVVSHDSYLINLASGDAVNRPRSLALFREEIERCEALDIPLLVTHPGAHLGAGEQSGLSRIAAALDQTHHDLPGYRTLTCLETTAGSGSTLGHRFEHLRSLLDRVREPDRLAVCIDTAHMLAAGYDLTSAAGMAATLDELDDIVGLRHVRVVHINDSKSPRGSRVDRHAHIGQGHIALAAFRTLVNHQRLARVPKILETPKGQAPDGRAWDTLNLQRLRRMCRQPGNKTRPSQSRRT